MKSNIIQRVVNKVVNRIFDRLARKRFEGAQLDHVLLGSELNRRFEIRCSKKLKIGFHTAIAGDCFINARGGVTIGRYCHIAKGLTIYSHNHNWRSVDCIPYDDKCIEKPVYIGDCVWIGANVTISPGTIIGDGVIVSSGSVVFGEIPKCAIIRGNPAQIIGYRDEVLFNDLFEKGKFA